MVSSPSKRGLGLERGRGYILFLGNASGLKLPEMLKRKAFQSLAVWLGVEASITMPYSNIAVYAMLLYRRVECKWAVGGIQARRSRPKNSR